MRERLNKILLASIDHRKLVAVLFIILTVIIIAGGLFLTVDKRVNVMSKKQLKEAIIDTRTTDRMLYDNTSIVFFEHENLFTQKALEALYEFHVTMTTSPLAKRTDSLFNVISFRNNDDTLAVRPVLYKIPTTEAGLEQAREDSLHNPFLVTNFITGKGNVAAIYVTSSGRLPNGKRDLYAAGLNAQLDKELAKLAPEFKRVFHIGVPRINKEITNLITSDMAKLSPIAIIILIVMIMSLFRIRFSVLIPLGCALLSIIWTFGLMGWLGVPINILNSVLPTLTIVISAAAGIHIFSAYLHELSNGRERIDAVKAMLTRIGLPVLLAAVTTFFGFSVNAFSKVIMIKYFGYSSMIAVVATGFISLFLFPTLLCFFGPKKTSLSFEKTKSGERSWIRKIALGLSSIAINRQMLVYILAFVFIACAAFFTTQVQINNNLHSYFSSNTQMIKDVEHVDKSFQGTENFYVDIRANKPDAFKEPKNMMILEEIEQYVQKSEDFSSTISLADQLKIINQEMHDGNKTFYRIPRSRNLIEQYLLFFNRQDLKPFVSNNYQEAYIIVRHSITNSTKLDLAVKKLEQFVAKKNWPGIKVKVSGAFLKMQQMAISLVEHQIFGLPFVFIAILMIMSLAFASLKTGLLSLVPNVFPVLSVFAFMGIFGIALNPGTVIVAFIAIGVGIDDTAHIFSIYRYHMQRLGEPKLAIKETLTHELLPVTTTSLALSSGFFILTFSSFQMIADFGIVSMVAILSALVADLLITPALLMRLK